MNRFNFFSPESHSPRSKSENPFFYTHFYGQLRGTLYYQCLPWDPPPPPLFFPKKPFLGFGISWMSITWIVLCLLAIHTHIHEIDQLAAKIEYSFTKQITEVLLKNAKQQFRNGNQFHHFQPLCSSLEAFFLRKQVSPLQDCYLSVLSFSANQLVSALCQHMIPLTNTIILD